MLKGTIWFKDDEELKLDEGYIVRKFIWKNGNFLLKKQNFNGLKTGHTEAAGPCLSASFNNDKDNFIVLIFNSESMSSRWKEV